MPRWPLILSLLAAFGLAEASDVSTLLPGAELRGEATFRFLGLPLYDARLYTPGGAPLDWEKDFGLKLTYRQSLSEYDLVEATLREMQRNGGRPRLEGPLTRCFEDVAKGDSFLALSEGPNRLGFWLNGAQTCWLDHPGIKQRFMEIFLGDNTRSQSFTRRLRGM